MSRYEVIVPSRTSVARLAGLAIVGGLVIGLAACTITTVPTGHVGVLTLFGRVTGERLSEGIHVINPLESVNALSIRTQEAKESAEVPSSEGLLVRLDASLIYRLDSTRASEVFQQLGPTYLDVLVIPNLRSVMRAVTAAHPASSLYSEGRESVAGEMLVQLKRAVERHGILIENVLLRDIKLPAALKTSIEAKQQADQEAQRMNFVLLKEKQEAERKRIEAQGISDFQRIVSQGISQQLLEWKGIEATMEIAKSGNTKVVLIGNPKNGLPLIMPAQ